ncbi:MAG: endonuclease/exonuclease/phosphatase family protein, partial [Chloroflexota bacterium]
MSGQPKPYLSLLRRILNRIVLLYLLLMITYGLSRLIIQDRLWFLSLINTFAPVVFIPLPILLLWVLIIRSRRAALYLLPILIWMTLWFGPRFLPKNRGASVSNIPSLRVMTNNISHFNQSPERVPALVLTQNPDVIFLQEVQLTDTQQALSALESAYPYQTRQYDDMRTSMYSAVNITYSRFPFVISEEVDPHVPEMPTIYRNVIELNGQRIALYNIHLLSPGGAGRFTRFANNYFVRYAMGFNDTIRNSQIEALLAYLATEPYPYIAAGDFNTSDFSMTYTRLATY